jgi:hypothetical protein
MRPISVTVLIRFCTHNRPYAWLWQRSAKTLPHCEARWQIEAAEPFATPASGVA